MTSHIVDVLADTTPIGHLDFTPPCETEDCETSAAWILWRVRCCPTAPAAVLVCHDCRRRIWNWRDIAECIYCRRVVFFPAHTAFYRCEPLRGDT